jgi:SAM-dependent methyltransferase
MTEANGFYDHPLVKGFVREDDEDVKWFFRNLTEPPPLRVLEVGANQESVSWILSNLGYDIVGVDLFPYTGTHPYKHRHIIGDFCELEFEDKFDIVVSTSAIEHFGINVYKEGHKGDDYDAVAVGKVWAILNPNGVFYVTVPFGSKYMVENENWRVYDSEQLKQRIIQQFTVDRMDFFMSADESASQLGFLPRGTVLTKAEAITYDGPQPHLTVGLKLRKGKE